MTQTYHDKITQLFDEYYEALPDAKPAPKRRVGASNALVEGYIEAHGKRPPASVLSRLATYVLLDTLSDSHPDKMAREEYPIMSYGQTGRYFARHSRLKDEPYDHEEVVGYSPGLDGREAIINPETSEQKAENWRLFIREVLTEREAFIIEQSYGGRATQAEISEKLGVSRQRVGVIMTRSLEKIREELTK